MFTWRMLVVGVMCLCVIVEKKERERWWRGGGGLERQNTWYALKIDLIFVSFVAA